MLKTLTDLCLEKNFHLFYTISGMIFFNINFIFLFFSCFRYHTTGHDWLNISPVQKEDYGEYLCTARNELGVAEAVVIVEPPGM